MNFSLHTHYISKYFYVFKIIHLFVGNRKNTWLLARPEQDIEGHEVSAALGSILEVLTFYACRLQLVAKLQNGLNSLQEKKVRY